MTTIDLNERKEPAPGVDVNRDNWRQYLGATLTHGDMLRLQELAKEAGVYVEAMSLADGWWYIHKGEVT